MPRPRARRGATTSGADPSGTTAHGPAADRATPSKRDLDERDRKQSAQRKAPGPRRAPAGQRVNPARNTSDVPPTDPA